MPELPAFDTLDDEALLALIHAADESALSSLYARYGRLVYSIALHITDDAQATEEVLQDVFHAVWQRAAQFRPTAGSVQTWLAAITRHRAIDEVRGRWQRNAARTLSLDMLPDLAATWERGLEQMATLRADLSAALNNLPLPQRETIELSFFDGFTMQEIAQRLDVPLGTIKSRMRQGLDKLRQSVSDWWDEAASA